MTLKQKIILLAFAVLVALVLYATFKQSQACKESGGVLVRGVFGYECIKQ